VQQKVKLMSPPAHRWSNWSSW